ncbi:MAG: hypothetical protein HY721_14350 [Planctomycetes bacterium]|nr:hypothetical protein [Planctomycetota bacterium]
MRLSLVVLGVVVGAAYQGEPRAQAPVAAGELKENLDLPFDAAAAIDDEEDAPEIVVLYGQVLEGDGFIFVGEGTT